MKGWAAGPSPVPFLPLLQGGTGDNGYGTKWGSAGGVWAVGDRVEFAVDMSGKGHDRHQASAPFCDSHRANLGHICLGVPTESSQCPEPHFTKGSISGGSMGSVSRYQQHQECSWTERVGNLPTHGWWVPFSVLPAYVSSPCWW